MVCQRFAKIVPEVWRVFALRCQFLTGGAAVIVGRGAARPYHGKGARLGPCAFEGVAAGPDEEEAARWDNAPYLEADRARSREANVRAPLKSRQECPLHFLIHAFDDGFFHGSEGADV
ncbi:MAG: hypothetical protein V4672_17635, partial [Verrucomicrobiota bacterium]